jgi:tyrosine-protein kinase Etk/Wzc
LHEVFGCPRERGLTELLDSTDPLSRLPLQSMGFIRETGIPGLSFLPAGALNPEGAALLHSARTEELLRRLELDFDFLVLDTPPLLRVADARVLARFSGTAVAVMRLEGTTREEAQLATSLLVEDGSRLLGVLLNGWKPHAGLYGHGSGHYDYSPVRRDETRERTLAASA